MQPESPIQKHQSRHNLALMRHMPFLRNGLPYPLRSFGPLILTPPLVMPAASTVLAWAAWCDLWCKARNRSDNHSRALGQSKAQGGAWGGSWVIHKAGGWGRGWSAPQNLRREWCLLCSKRGSDVFQEARMRSDIRGRARRQSDVWSQERNRSNIQGRMKR